MGNLSKNFSISEFTCPCCGKAVIKMELVRGLQELRDLADRPIRITSGYRCEKHNAAVGGEKNSLHLEGKAADIVIEGLTVQEMAELAEKVEVFRDGGIGVYPKEGYIHVDIRKERTRW